MKVHDVELPAILCEHGTTTHCGLIKPFHRTAKENTVPSQRFDVIPTESRVLKLDTCKDYRTCEFQHRGKSGVDNFVPWSLDDPGTGLKIEVNHTSRDGKHDQVSEVELHAQ